MTAAGSIWVLLPSVTVRSLGSAALWIYSTLLLQFRVPNEIQGEWGPVLPVTKLVKYFFAI